MRKAWVGMGLVRAELLNLPNILSILRIAAAPFLVLLLLSPDETLSIISAAFFLTVCLTDWLDGFLARRLNIETVIGKFLDPLADKLLIVTALIMLIPIGRVPAWMVALIVAREIAVTGLRAVAINLNVVISASSLGKLKTITQISAAAFLLLHYPFFGIDFHTIGMIILWLALIITVWSGVDYFVRFFWGLQKTP